MHNVLVYFVLNLLKSPVYGANAFKETDKDLKQIHSQQI